MYAIVDVGGKQYKVEEEQIIYVEKVKSVEAGDEITLDKVLFLKTDENSKVGTPYVDGAKVVAEVVEHGKDRKVQIVKFEGRKNYRRKKGHRQPYTALKVKEIQG
ncbi:50S ribosomal protein L21 [Petrotoga sp. 9PWA.NaAc.5.4]|uniref:50S ribosomal protein L21 n=1 Tax=Petrotoga sp. 9PWA.NaAc.5.4 TaxID=1434328 RepID=UPI000CBC8B9F|nr:50S ribosomal protein L21 [Petrotoga sp. 9PWA.NaAc.5.4]PNR97149.1 50S ribosomal protein L21 [Petrotoga sp. 9PWA.NaAc.5.4]